VRAATASSTTEWTRRVDRLFVLVELGANLNFYICTNVELQLGPTTILLVLMMLKTWVGDPWAVLRIKHVSEE
jgi:hypothetical protein